MYNLYDFIFMLYRMTVIFIYNFVLTCEFMQFGRQKNNYHLLNNNYIINV